MLPLNAAPSFIAQNGRTTDSTSTAYFSTNIQQFKVTDKPELLYGIRQITTDAQALSYDKAGKLVTKDVELTLIPYYAWAHRGEGDMEVWLPIDVSATSAQPQKAGQWEDNGFFKN